jgi:ribosomal protein L29
MAGKREEAKFREDLTKMTDEEIGVELKNLRSRHFTLRSQAVTEKVEDISGFGIAKRNIARLLTEQNARRRAKAAK